MEGQLRVLDQMELLYDKGAFVNVKKHSFMTQIHYVSMASSLKTDLSTSKIGRLTTIWPKV